MAYDGDYAHPQRLRYGLDPTGLPYSNYFDIDPDDGTVKVRKTLQVRKILSLFCHRFWQKMVVFVILATNYHFCHLLKLVLMIVLSKSEKVFCHFGNCLAILYDFWLFFKNCPWPRGTSIKQLFWHWSWWWNSQSQKKSAPQDLHNNGIIACQFHHAIDWLLNVARVLTGCWGQYWT